MALIEVNFSTSISPKDTATSSTSMKPQQSTNKLLVGVCAMSKKATSKPMRQILARLSEYYGDYLEVMIFDEKMIIQDPVEKWPVVQVLICFHAKGFPMAKAQAYVRLREPYVPNDLEKQADLLDRTKVYKTLESIKVDIPRYAVMRRGDGTSEDKLEEFDDHVVVNGQVFNKPFVEKPVSAEDHNIHIYYPSSAGGGSQRLFRKVNDRSSEFSADNHVRRHGSYIYEEFMPTDGTDVKVYAVGPDYAHAEARKSPALDGKVERDSDGKEIRYPIILTNFEKAIARKIVYMFRQTVCGFDLLRANGKSYVCDVNGFSFVKSSTKYYEDSARILGNMIMRHFAPSLRIPWSPPSFDDPPLVSTTYGTMMELRCVLGVIRHGDRTPKQKLKMEVFHSKWHELFNTYAKPAKLETKVKELKLKRPNQLQEVLDIVRWLLGELEKQPPSPVSESNSSTEPVFEIKGKLEQVKTVLEMYGHFSGINRKVQLKYLTDGKIKKTSDTETDSGIKTDPRQKLLFILKWGGELTPAGEMQAEELGKAFRCLYPGGQGQHGADSRGLGFLRLHSTFRHDLKIYASEEGRVQMTAAAFTKGLLALEGKLGPILVQMVKSANTDGLLDDDKEARQYQSSVKKYLHQYLQVDRVLNKDDIAKLNPGGSKSIENALLFIENPRRKCDRIWNLATKIYDIIRIRRHDSRLKEHTLYLSETWDLAERRWNKLIKDFRHVKKDEAVYYDISKIPDIYDNIKYDLEHNVKIFNMDDMEELYICSKYMADVVVPQEYGIQKQEKMLIGQGICTPLMKKLMCDLKACKTEEDDSMLSTRLDPRASEGIQTPARHVRTRLYFTSESHIHSLMSILRWGDLVPDINDKQWQRAMNFLSSVTEFNYMAQLVIMLYEDRTKDIKADDRFHVELHFSPGALPCIQTTHVAGLGYRPKSKENEQNNTSSNGSASAAVSRLASIDETKSTEIGGPSDNANEISEKPPPDVYARKGSLNAMSAPVNIVAIGDRTNRPITTEELAMYSPSTSPQIPTSISWPPSDRPPLVKSVSEVTAATASVGENDDPDQPNYNANVVAVTEQTTNARKNARLFYAGVKHHTTNFLRYRDEWKHLNNLRQLISTAVISGGRFEDKTMGDPFLANTAVIARGASEPDLLTFSKIAQATQQDVNDISFYVPPLRSLETLHNQLSLRQVVEFLERVTTMKTPAPSPPKTPRDTEVSRENSINATGKRPSMVDQLRLSTAIAERLQKLHSDSDLKSKDFHHS